MSETDEPARPQYLQIDAMKLQLMTNLNLLIAEVRMYREERRSFTHNLVVDRTTHNKEVTKFTISINERLDYLLEIAKNVFINPIDPEGLEYKRFEDVANRLVRQGLIKPKLGGLKRKKLG
jgi:hypothetical protein